jgi:RimJ/RimL family protein N-acetyltransferase
MPSGRPPVDWKERLPADFVLRRIDRDIAERLQKDLIASGNPPWFEAVWGSIDNFLEHGFGFVILCDEAIVSNCRTWSVNEGIAAIQVSTRVKYRQRNLATFAGSAFIEHCLTNGLIPEYSCEQENVASAKLAQKLGFIPIGTTP